MVPLVICGTMLLPSSLSASNIVRFGRWWCFTCGVLHIQLGISIVEFIKGSSNLEKQSY